MSQGTALSLQKAGSVHDRQVTKNQFLPFKLKKGIAHVFLIVILAVAILAIPIIIAVFVFHKKLPFSGKEQVNVALKTDYKNPFNKTTQYTNPFGEYKNPFINLRQ